MVRKYEHFRAAAALAIQELKQFATCDCHDSAPNSPKCPNPMKSLPRVHIQPKHNGDQLEPNIKYMSKYSWWDKRQRQTALFSPRKQSAQDRHIRIT